MNHWSPLISGFSFFIYKEHILKTIDEQIRTGQFSNIYLLYGQENYLKQQYKNKLRQAFAAPGDTMNTAYFEGSKINPLAVIDLQYTHINKNKI